MKRRVPDPKASKLAYQQRRIVEFWLERPRHERTTDDLTKFYGWLSEHQPDLIPGGPGSFQQLRALLIDHVIERPE